MDHIETLIVELMVALQTEATRRLGIAQVKVDIGISAPSDHKDAIMQLSDELQVMLNKGREAAMENTEKVSLQ